MIQEEEGVDLQLATNKKYLMGIHIAGIDEVGKGALFGPVFAGAVCLSRKAECKLIKAGLSFSAAAKYLAKKNNLSKNYIYKLYYN